MTNLQEVNGVNGGLHRDLPRLALGGATSQSSAYLSFRHQPTTMPCPAASSSPLPLAALAPRFLLLFRALSPAGFSLSKPPSASRGTGITYLAEAFSKPPSASRGIGITHLVEVCSQARSARFLLPADRRWRSHAEERCRAGNTSNK